MYIYLFFQILFYCSLLQDTEYRLLALALTWLILHDRFTKGRLVWWHVNSLPPSPDPVFFLGEWWQSTCVPSTTVDAGKQKEKGIAPSSGNCQSSGAQRPLPYPCNGVMEKWGCSVQTGHCFREDMVPCVVCLPFGGSTFTSAVPLPYPSPGQPTSWPKCSCNPNPLPILLRATDTGCLFNFAGS